MGDELVYKVGSTKIEKILEMDLIGMTLAQLMPDLPDGVAQSELHESGLSDGEGGAILSLHIWLVRHRDMVILVDTGAGNDKIRPAQKVLDRLQNPLLERLSRAGVEASDVNYILHTHIHSDHVGWDTRLIGGTWVPTFPRATIICSELEWRYAQALANADEDEIDECRLKAGLGNPVRVPNAGTFADSLLPLVGRVPFQQINVDGEDVLPGLRFLPTPGHSIDHASIELESDGCFALFSGDVFHHPLEITFPDLVSVFCEFPVTARQSRELFMRRAVETSATVFTSHFPQSSAGKITLKGDRFFWQFI
jgi:glyoxylase-like metal-dependent hydrolase (beta-lactamase superfamily II)